MKEKKMMYDLSDAYIILPGGIGTLEELSEIITWKVLGIEDKKIIIFNLNGFYDNLIKQFKMMEENNFLYNNILQKIIIIKDSNKLDQVI